MTRRTACSIVFFAFAATAGPGQTLRNLSLGKPLPVFTLEDAGGHRFTSLELQGNPVVIIYLKPGQATSESLYVDGAKWARKYPNLRFLFLSAGDADSVRAESVSPPILVDREKRLYGEWGIRVFPSIVMISADGFVLKTSAGYGIGAAERMHDDLVRLFNLGNAESDHAAFPGTPAEEKSDDAARIYQEGKRLWEDGFPERSREKWMESLEADSNYVPSHLSLAKYFERSGEIEEAEAHLSAALGVEPSAEAFALKARCRILKHDLDGAVRLLNSALDLNRRSVEAKLALAEVYLLQDSVEESSAVVEDVLAMNKNYPRGLYLRGRIAEARNNLEAAFECYRQAFDLLENSGKANAR